VVRTKVGKRVDLDLAAGDGLGDGLEACEGVGAVNVHRTASADALAARPDVTDVFRSAEEAENA